MRQVKTWEDRLIYHRWLFLFQKKLVGALMRRGLRAKAFSRYQQSLQILKNRQGVAPSTMMLAAFLRLSPEVQLKGSEHRSYVAPVSDSQRVSLAVRWLVRPLRQSTKRGTVSPRRLADAVEEVLNNRGPAVLEKHKIYKQAAFQKHQPLPYKYL